VLPCSHFSHGNAHGVVQPPVALVLAQVEDGSDDLPPADRIRPSVPMPLEQDRRSVVRLDHRSEVGAKRPVTPSTRVVGASKTPADTALAEAFGKVEVLLPLTCETDGPAVRVGEADPIERLEPHEAGDQMNGVVFVTAMKPRRSRIGRLSSEASV